MATLFSDNIVGAVHRSGGDTVFDDVAGDTAVWVGAADTTDVATAKVSGDTVVRFAVNADGTLEWGPGNGALDQSLSRPDASQLRVSTSFTAVQDIIARINGAADTRVGAVGPGSESGVKFGSAGDTNLYRSAANMLKTDDAFTAVGQVDAAAALPLKFSNAGAAQTTVGAAGGASALPATPTKYFKIVDSAGATLVVAAYAAA